jgi:hypothetical protein
MPSSKTLNVKNLLELGAERLAELLIEISSGNLTVEQSVPDKGGDLAIADLDRQAAQAMTPAFAMETHPVSSRFPDGVNLDHWNHRR